MRPCSYSRTRLKYHITTLLYNIQLSACKLRFPCKLWWDDSRHCVVTVWVGDIAIGAAMALLKPRPHGSDHMAQATWPRSHGPDHMMQVPVVDLQRYACACLTCSLRQWRSSLRCSMSGSHSHSLQCDHMHLAKAVVSSQS